jgi:hypothetical protein
MLRLKVFLAVIGLLVAVFITVHLSGGGLGLHPSRQDPIPS